jgi:hypothetical protein
VKWQVKWECRKRSRPLFDEEEKYMRTLSNCKGNYRGRENILIVNKEAQDIR